MSNERKQVEHPSWCDGEACTAPEYRPTDEEYRSVGAGSLGEHRSRVLIADKNRPSGGLLISLVQQVAPWNCATFLCFQIGEGEYPERIFSEVGDVVGAGFDLFELLAQDIGAQAMRYPTLYKDRFGYVADAIADRATAEASMPRDPVELEERMTAELVADEDEHQEEAAVPDRTLMATCTPNSQPHKDGRVEHGYQINVLDEDMKILATVDLPDWDRFRPASAGHRLIEHGYMIRSDARGPETVNGWTNVPHLVGSWSTTVFQLDGRYPWVSPYNLTINGKTKPRITFREVRAAIAELVTDRLEKDPERLALDAQTVNMAFNSGAVEQSITERGDWYTVFDAYGEDPVRIRVTREG